MSFSESCLDGFEQLSKKTSQSLDGIRGISSLLRHLSETLRDLGTSSQSACSRYKSKKVNFTEGTLKAALLATLTEIETTLSEPFLRLSDQISQISRATDAWVKDRDLSRRRMFGDASNIRKEWEQQQSNLRKAKEAFHARAKEVPRAKDIASANQRARQADERYSEVLAQTNDVQRKIYERDQPALLGQIQRWEEDRVSFARDQLAKLSGYCSDAGIPAKWEGMVSSIASCAADVDVRADLDAYVTLVRTNAKMPPPMSYEAAPEGPSLGPSTAVTASLQMGSTSQVSLPVPTPHASAPAMSTSAASPRRAGNSPPNPVVAHLSTESVPPPKSPRAAAIAAAVESVVESSSPRRVVQPQQQGEGNQEEGQRGGKGGSSEFVPEGGVWYKALYDYEASNDGETSLREGERVLVTEKDSSGWWFASHKDGSEGFIPAAYIVEDPNQKK